jgi:hypothetical protein
MIGHERSRAAVLSSGVASAAVVLSLLSPAPAFGQGPVLRLDQLSRLAAQATNVVDVTVDPALLEMAAGFLARQKPDDAAAKELIEGLEGVYVKQFEFDAVGAYTDASSTCGAGATVKTWKSTPGAKATCQAASR